MKEIQILSTPGRRVLLVSLFHLFTFSPLSAQWTLRECCDYAVSHNLTVRTQENARRQQELQLSTARNARLPDLNASVGQNFSFGRGLTSENTYSNTNTSSTALSLSTSVPLFTGFQIPNSIRLHQLNLQAASADLEKAKDDVRTQVAQAYVQILYDAELADVAARQVAIDSAQVVRLEGLVRNGKASEAELSQQRATLAQSRLTATEAESSRRLSLLTLTQLLELPSAEGFTIARPQFSDEAAVASSTSSPSSSAAPSDGTGHILPSHVGEGLGVGSLTAESVFADAIAVKPAIAAQELRVKASERNVKLAQAAGLPSLSLSAGVGTNYYTTSGFESDGFSKQLENNFSQYIGVNLSVPIFSRFSTRNNVRSARIEQETQQIQLDNTKKALYKEIQQVFCNAVNAESKERASLYALQASEDAFRLMQAKYENGKATSTEFNEAKNSYLKASSDLVQARYEHLYHRALLDFYRGRPLEF